MTLISELLGRSPAARRALDLLISTAGQELHTREIARRIKADPHSTQLALDHLLRAGALTSKRLGNLRLWSVDPASDRIASIRGDARLGRGRRLAPPIEIGAGRR